MPGNFVPDVEKGNRYPGTRTEGPRQDESKETSTKITYHNLNGKS